MLTAPDYLSPSSIATFLQCPLKYKFSRIDGIVEPPTEATIFGNFVHSILENFYSLPKTERVAAAARLLASSIWPSYEDDVRKLLHNDSDKIRGFRWRAWWCIENLMKMEDVSTQDFSGIETELNSDISGVKIKGFIDRWSLDDDGIIIGDYKTGKIPKPQYAGDKFDQLLIYGIVLSTQLGKDINRLELLYVSHSRKLVHTPSESDINRINEMVVSVRSGIDERCQTGNFETKTGPLCPWCYFKASCPAWNGFV